MLRHKLICIFLLFSFCCLSCSSRQQKIPIETLEKNIPVGHIRTIGVINGTQLVIDRTIDLKDSLICIPQGVDLVFKGGKIMNGTLEGSNTKLFGNLKGILKNVHIKGTWNVPLIYSTMFIDSKRIDVLRDLFAFQNSNIQNKIIIDKNKYVVKARKLWDICLFLGSNTELINKGHIILQPNDYLGCNIIRITGHNIKITGGILEGDKFKHTGKQGEWGMGVELNNARNVQIKNLSIKNCWGDCIYIGNSSKNITIDSCYLDNGRRQGISIISGDDILVNHCIISNVSGTPPAFAIDVEPNKNDTVRFVRILNSKFSNCQGGLFTEGEAKGSFVDYVIIDSCSISNMRGESLVFNKTKTIEVRNCSVLENHEGYQLHSKNINNLTIDNNSIHTNKKTKGDHSFDNLVKMENCNNRFINNNKIK